MKTSRICFSLSIRVAVCQLLLGMLFICAGTPSLPAQSSATGTITGRILNPASGEYVRNAEVQVVGGKQTDISEEGGYYRLTNVPAGEVTVEVKFPGYSPTTSRVLVTPGGSVLQDFTLTGATGAGRKGDETIKLDSFIVSSGVTGQAKAVAEQKTAMNMKVVVSSDNFGDVTEGNIGEFLKFMPGVVLDYVEADTRAARMSGMDARYGYVTLDGNTMASGGADRQFEFESVSINNVESIEVNKTLSADMSGDAPAGTINLRTKSALDRKGSRFNFALGFIGNEYDLWTIRKTARPDDDKHAKLRPTGTFDYSNAFFGNKVGIAVNGTSTSVYKPQFRHRITYDYTSPIALTAGSPVVSGLNYKDGPRITEKSSGGLKVDYQPFAALRVSLTGSYTYYDDTFANRNVDFVVSPADIMPGSSETRVIARATANANTRLDHTGATDHRHKDQTNTSLGFTYKLRRLTVDGLASYSRAREQRGATQIGAVEQANIRLTRIGWTAERDAVDSNSWRIAQTAGPSWYDLSNYGRSDAQAGNIIRGMTFSKVEEYTGRLNARYVMDWKLPTFFKTGVQERVTTRANRRLESFTATYVGPQGNQLQTTMPLSIATLQIAEPWGSDILPLPVPNKAQINAYTLTNPAYFVRTVANQAANLDAVLSNPRSNQERIDAAYLLQNTRVGKWQLEGGLRYERTVTRSKQKEAVPIARNPFAVIGTNPTTGARTYAAASTLEYVNYRWSRGTTTDYGSYADWLPSASAKYPFNRNLNLKLGYNKAIKRPNLTHMSGPWLFSGAEPDVTITIPNPGLRPERSEKLSGILEYYFEPAGVGSVHVFQTDIKNASDKGDPVPASAVGYGDDPTYASYFFDSYTNVPGERRVKGIELSYSQQLTFFRSELLRGISVFGTYSRYTASPRPRDAKWAAQNATGGLTWRYRRFHASLNATWVDEILTGNAAFSVPSNSRYFTNEVEYIEDRFVCDFGAGFRITRQLSLYASARNPFNSPKIWYYKSDGRLRQIERYGGQWTFGVKGEF